MSYHNKNAGVKVKRNVFILTAGAAFGILALVFRAEAVTDDIVYEIEVDLPQKQVMKTERQLIEEQEKKRMDDARKAGEAAAEMMKQNYKILDTPNFPGAYYYYLEDLKVIAEKGLAPERLNLFRDLELMNSKDVYIYYDSNDDYSLHY